MTTTSPITLAAHRGRPYTRRQERRMLAAALRRRDRARRLDNFVYRFQGPISVLALTGAASILISAVVALRMVGL